MGMAWPFEAKARARRRTRRGSRQRSDRDGHGDEERGQDHEQNGDGAEVLLMVDHVRADDQLHRGHGH